jgi:hypothetical protein
MANCPNPPGTLTRLNLGPLELDLLGLQVSIPSGLCVLLRAGTLSPVVQRALVKQMKSARRMRLSGTLINDGKSRSRILLSPMATSVSTKRVRFKYRNFCLLDHCDMTFIFSKSLDCFLNILITYFSF